MKQFLYLDTDIVDSIVAQAERGLAQGITVEKEEETSEEIKKEKQVQGSLNGSGSILGFLRTTGEIGGEINTGSEEITSMTSRGIVAKVMHDAAFDIAMEKVKPKEEIDPQLGAYFTITKEFSFIDLAYLRNLFSDKGIMDFLKESYREEAEKIVKSIKDDTNREQRRNKNFDEKKEIRKIMEENAKQYDDAAKMLDVFKSMAPYERMLISDDGYLIPLEDKYFRITPSNLGFRYSGKITCVGMITNIIKDNNDDNDNFFLTIQNSVNEALKTLLPVSTNTIYVAHPIAVYYESDQ